MSSADAPTLAQLLSLGALIGATIEYIEIVKRRTTARWRAAQGEETARVGLQGLVRVFLADPADQEPG
jgi:hypothetical protein